jgi:hypothetical protein
VFANVNAALGGQSAATPITARNTRIQNCVSGAAVILTVQPWPETLFNRCGTGQASLVFPPLGQQIEGYGVNVAASLADRADATFTYDGVMTWLVS